MIYPAATNTLCTSRIHSLRVQQLVKQITIDRFNWNQQRFTQTMIDNECRIRYCMSFIEINTANANINEPWNLIIESSKPLPSTCTNCDLCPFHVCHRTMVVGGTYGKYPVFATFHSNQILSICMRGIHWVLGWGDHGKSNRFMSINNFSREYSSGQR